MSGQVPPAVHGAASLARPKDWKPEHKHSIILFVQLVFWLLESVTRQRGPHSVEFFLSIFFRVSIECSRWACHRARLFAQLLYRYFVSSYVLMRWRHLGPIPTIATKHCYQAILMIRTCTMTILWFVARHCVCDTSSFKICVVCTRPI